MSPLRYLIVEDEALLAMDIGFIVEDAGHIVVAEATSLADVSALPDGIAPDVAFVDVQLAEGSSGIDACALIRQRWKDALVIFVTANPKKLPADYAGGHGVISKPYSRLGLRSAVRYIEQGVTNPPPKLPRPLELTPAPGLNSAWAY